MQVIEKVDIATLSKVMDELPIQIVNHSNRVKEISKFIIRRFELDDWYLDMELKQEELVEAIYFHDIGKSKVASEYLYKDLCNGPKELQRYNQHIDFGLEIINYEDRKDFIYNNPHCFETYLYQAIRYHHSNEEDIPFAGIVTYIADTIDNNCYQVASDVVNKLSIESFNELFKNLALEFERRRVRKEIINYFNEKYFVREFVEFLNKLYSADDKDIHYGINIEKYDIYDIYQYNEKEIDDTNINQNDLTKNEIFGQVFTYSIHSRYYGLINHNAFIGIANKVNLAGTLDNYFIEDLEADFELKEIDTNKMNFINISLNTINKPFIKKISKFVSSFDIEPSKVVLLFEVFDPVIESSKVDLLKDLQSAGFKIALNNIKSEYIEIFKQVQVDYAFYDNFKTHQVDNVFVELIQSLGTIIILMKQGETSFRYVCSETNNYDSLLDKGSGDIG